MTFSGVPIGETHLFDPGTNWPNSARFGSLLMQTGVVQANVAGAFGQAFTTNVPLPIHFAAGDVAVILTGLDPANVSHNLVSPASTTDFDVHSFWTDATSHAAPLNFRWFAFGVAP